MEYYVINSGFKLAVGEDTVDPRVIQHLLPLAREGGRLPRPYSAFEVQVAHTEGGGLFTLWRDRSPICAAGVCGLQRSEVEIWSSIEEIYLTLSDSYADWMNALKAPSRPARLPWIALMFMPLYPLVAKGEIAWIDDFTRSFGVTLMKATAHVECK